MKIENVINGEYGRLEALCERDDRACRMLAKLYETCLRQEREHRAFGARFTRGQAKYKRSIRLAARYFAVKTVIAPLRVEDNTVESALRALAGLRDDHVQGAILAAYLRERGIPYKLEPFTADVFNAIDYSKDFAA